MSRFACISTSHMLGVSKIVSTVSSNPYELIFTVGTTKFTLGMMDDGNLHLYYTDTEEIIRTWESYVPITDLAIVDIEGGVRLTWTDNSTGEDGFEIFVSVDGGEYYYLDSVAANTETYDDLTDYRGSTVEYKIRSYTGEQYSAYSDPAEISVDPDILTLAATWINDFARITFVGISGWQTEIWESKNGTDYTLATTLDSGVGTYDSYTWQGTIVYFKARAKNGDEYGDYTEPISLSTPLVLKYDNSPVVAVTIGGFGLPAGKTVNIKTQATNTDIILNNGTSVNFGNIAVDPAYIQLSGDITSITTLTCFDNNVLCYGDISKWVLWENLVTLYLSKSKFSGDLSSWIIPSTVKDIRLYNSSTGQNIFTGDLSSWTIPDTGDAMTMYISYNAFTGIPRGAVRRYEASAAGLYMRDCSCNTAAIDAFLAYANTWLATNTPVRNSLFQLANSATTNMGVPTGGNSNTDRVGIQAKYTAAGYTATVTVRTS